MLTAPKKINIKYTERQIIKEGKNHWIGKRGVGFFEVLKNGITHSVVCDTIHFSDNEEKALNIAIEKFNKREGILC